MGSDYSYLSKDFRSAIRGKVGVDSLEDVYDFIILTLDELTHSNYKLRDL